MLAAAGDPIGTPTRRLHWDLDRVCPGKTFLQASARLSQPPRAVVRRCDDDPAVGAHHRDGVLDGHRAHKSERLTCDVEEDRRLWEDDVQAPPDSVGRFRLGRVLAGQPIEVAHPIDLTVAARPNQAEATAVAQDATDL